MRLIGMLDSPYVRRVAISLDVLGVEFTHEAVSVFSTFEEFKKINPVVKAPTLILDNSEVLMDSSLILQFIEWSIPKANSLWSDKVSQLAHQFRAVSLAMAACDKAVQFVYETQLKPASAQHAPWLARVNEQIASALSLLELEISRRQDDFGHRLNQENITSAVTWHFIHSMLPGITRQGNYPELERLSESMEATAVFIKYSAGGPGVKAQD